MITWILGGLACIFFILWLAKKPKKDIQYTDIGCETALKICVKEKAILEANNEMFKSNILRYKNELGEKQQELIKVTAELRECLANCGQQKVSDPPAVIQYIDAEVSTDSKERLSYFEVFTDEKGHYRWRFKAKNNKIVADSGEGYTTKQNLKKGINAFINAVKTEEYNVKWNKN